MPGSTVIDPEASDTCLVKPEVLNAEAQETGSLNAEVEEKGQASDGTFHVPSPCIVALLSGIMFVGSMSNGIVFIGIPIIASDLGLPENLLLWCVV